MQERGVHVRAQRLLRVCKNIEYLSHVQEAYHCENQPLLNQNRMLDPEICNALSSNGVNSTLKTLTVIRIV